MSQDTNTLVEVNPETGKVVGFSSVKIPAANPFNHRVPNGVVTHSGRYLAGTTIRSRGLNVHFHGTVYILGIGINSFDLLGVEECLDVVSNGVGASVVIFMSDKTVKIFTSATAIDAFFKAYQ